MRNCLHGLNPWAMNMLAYYVYRMFVDGHRQLHSRLIFGCVVNALPMIDHSRAIAMMVAESIPHSTPVPPVRAIAPCAEGAARA